MTGSSTGLLDMLALPPLQRKIVVHLTRHGPAGIEELAQTVDCTPAEVEEVLTHLAREGRLRLSADGQAEALLGRTRRRTLPARLWPALLATSRLYSAQEIATLRAVNPILQFARARMSEFADHGPKHVLRVKSLATQLAYIMGLSLTEQHLLRAAALFHDVGNVLERERHHIISQQTVERLTLAGELPFSIREARLVGLVCRWHRGAYDPDQVDELRGETIRTGLLASILRVADAMDIDHRRSDYTERFDRVLRFFYPKQLPYWSSLEEIRGVRISSSPDVNLQVFTQGSVPDNMQIDMLRKDLGSTPLEWRVQQIAVENGAQPGQPRPVPTGKDRGRPVLLAFPFDAHSLVMAALSRRHLLAAGHVVELLSYPDTADGPAWLWREALADAADFAGLVVIGDRPNPGITPDLLRVVDRWQAAGAMVSLLNRHEANWSRLPKLLQRRVEIILGGDWAYFWGDRASQTDLAWGRIAALCTRDPTQSTVGLTDEEGAVTQGLLKVVYDAGRRPADEKVDWENAARPILDRIEADDRAYFAGQAREFGATYGAAAAPGRVIGRVLRFEQEELGDFPCAYYWALETAIESCGRRPVRGIQFNVPYAIATWTAVDPAPQAARGAGDEVELLAINHWREEEATPIRLLYPADLDPPPEGNESTIRVRLSQDEAQTVVGALLEACNQPPS